MIRLSGLEPDRDIAIEITGARPGEKFNEELFDVHERVQPTPAPRIMRADHERLDPVWVQRIFSDLNLLVLEGDASALATHVFDLSDSRVTLAADAVAPAVDRIDP
jgi:FlaA1/EpsC-like NDP-sugar epimerase